MADATGALLEFYVPCVKFEGLKTNKDVTIGDSSTVTLPSTTTIGGQSVVALGDITSSSTTATAFSVTNTGIYTGDAVVEFIANSATTGQIFSITANGLTSGGGLTISSTGTMVTTAHLLTLTANSATTAAGLFRINGNGLTSGIAAVITSSATAITGAGRLLRVDHTGATSTSGILSEFASAANDETVIVKITASDVNALGTALQISSATTTGNGITVTANALTAGFGISVASSATGMTSAGRLLSVVHSGNAGVSTIIAEVSSAAADETVIFKVTASAALAGGKVAFLSAAAVTTGTILDISNADGLTTGTAINVVSNSSDTGTHSLVRIVNDNTAATGTTPLYIQQDAVTSTNFKKLITLGTFTIWTSDETSPNTALSGTKGDICLNGSATGQAYWCTGTTNWTALA